MKLNTRSVTVNKENKEVFEWLCNIKNYEELMPENTKSFRLHESDSGLFVQIGALPEVGMKLKEKTANEKLIFESPSESFNYELDINLLEISGSKTEVKIDFNGKFNPMIEMMAKSPLQSFIDSIINNLEKKVW